MIAIALKAIFFTLFLLDDSDQQAHYILLYCYVGSYLVTNLIPAFYMLYSHYKTFKIDDILGVEWSEDGSIIGSNRPDIKMYFKNHSTG